MALSKVDLANQVENQLPQNLVANNLPFRNIIINGDMSIAQRVTSVSSYTSDAYSTVDRMKTRVGSLGTWTISQDTDVPSGQGFAKSLKWDCTTADASPSANDYLILEQNIEGQNLQYLKFGTANAVSLTASFWVKSNKIGNYTVGLQCAGNNRHIESSYTINVSNTWEKKTITFAGDTTGVLANDNSEEMKLWFWLGGGSNFSSGTQDTSWSSYVGANVLVSGQVNLADSTSNYINITGVQLEAGTTASDFEFLPHDVNLQRCYRYCYRINGNATDEQLTSTGGFIFSTSISSINYTFHPPLRAVPTVSESNSLEQVTNAAMSLSSLFDDNQVGDCNSVGVVFGADSGAPFTTNTFSNMRLQNTTAAFIEFDAEL